MADKLKTLNYAGKTFNTTTDIQNDSDLDDEEKATAIMKFNDLNKSTVNAAANQRQKQAEEADKEAGRDSKEDAMKAEFVRQKNVGHFEPYMQAAYNEWKSGQEGVKFLQSLGKATNSKGNEIKSEYLTENAQKQANAQSAANASYDAGTLQKKSDTVNATTQSNNNQKTANAILEKGKDKNAEVPNNTQAAQMGEEAANADHALSDNEIDENTNTVDDSLTSYVSETPNAEVKAVLSSNGYSPDSGEKPSTETITATNDMVAQVTGGKTTEAVLSDPVETEKEANRLGIWDKLAIAFTALSYIGAALGVGLPLDFTKIGGTKERITAMTELRKQTDAFNQSQQFRDKEQAKLQNEENKFRQEYAKNHNGALPTDAEVNDHIKEYRSMLGNQQYYNSAQSAKDTADTESEVQLKNLDSTLALKYLDRSTALTLDKDLKEMDAQTLNTIKINAENTKNSIAQLMAQGNQQRATASLLQDLQDKSPAQKYQYVLDITGDEASALRSINLPSSGDTALKWAQGVTNMVTQTVDTVANAVNTVTPSDENKKEVVHNYIVDRLNKQSNTHTYIPKERR